MDGGTLCDRGCLFFVEEAVLEGAGKKKKAIYPRQPIFLLTLNLIL